MKACIYGMVVKVGDLQCGRTADGKDWEKKNVVLAPQGDDRKVAADFFGEYKVKQVDQIKEGDNVVAQVEVYSREYTGKWYNQIDGISISKT